MDNWVPMGVQMIKLRFGNQVELRAQLLLHRRPYIQSETNTRIRATSATNAVNCRTCQLDKSYVSVHCPVHCIASPPSEVPSGRAIRVKGFKTGTRFPHSHIHTVSMRTIPQSPCITGGGVQSYGQSII